MSEELYDLFCVRVHPRTGEPTGHEFKIGGDNWVPMTHREACTVKSKFASYCWRRVELREVVTQ